MSETQGTGPGGRGLREHRGEPSDTLGGGARLAARRAQRAGHVSPSVGNENHSVSGKQGTERDVLNMLKYLPETSGNSGLDNET